MRRVNDLMGTSHFYIIGFYLRKVINNGWLVAFLCILFFRMLSRGYSPQLVVKWCLIFNSTVDYVNML